MPLTKSNQDFLSRHGATLIVDTITAYWQLRGFHGIKAERYLLNGTADTYGVRSNIVAGYPPQRGQGRPSTRPMAL